MIDLLKSIVSTLHNVVPISALEGGDGELGKYKCRSAPHDLRITKFRHLGYVDFTKSDDGYYLVNPS